MDTKRELRAPPPLDVTIIGITLLLVCLSLVMVYSTTAVVALEKYGDAYHFVKRQAFAAAIGVALMSLFSRLDVEALRRVSPFLLGAAIFLLLLTLVPGLGDSAGGAKRWINLGFVRFQPAEIVKLLFVIFIAGFVSRHESRIGSFRQGVAIPLAMVGLVAGLLLMQPDFGSAAIIAIVTLCMTTAAGARLRYLMMGGVAIALFGAIMVFVSPYRMGRVVSFLSPFSDASGKGYQLIQSLIAVGSGSMLGNGIGESQQKLFFLPAAHTDFIFAVIAEELGFIGCLVVMTLFMVFLWRGLKLAGRLADDTFSFALAVGLTMLIVVPAMLNVGVVLGLLPTKGMVLPLVGYGGSSLIACLTAVGLLLSLTRYYSRQIG